MKNAILLLALTLCVSFTNSQKSLLKKISIGRFAYSIYKENLYSHDDNWNAEYYTIYLAGSSQRLCSAYMLARRNDSTFIKGSYVLSKDKIEFTQRYYYSKANSSIDSLKTTFSPDRSGKLVLRETKEFKKGKVVTKQGL